MQPANLCFQCFLLHVLEKLPEWVPYDFWLWLTCACGCSNRLLQQAKPLQGALAAPRQSKLLYPWQLNSKPLAFKLGHVIPCGELTHDTRVVGDAEECYNVQQCTCLDADFWLPLYVIVTCSDLKMLHHIAVSIQLMTHPYFQRGLLRRSESVSMTPSSWEENWKSPVSTRRPWEGASLNRLEDRPSSCMPETHLLAGAPARAFSHEACHVVASRWLVCFSRTCVVLS